MTVDGLQPLENLVTLKFERCCNVDMSFLRLVSAAPELKNFSMRGSVRQMHPPGKFPTNFWNQLKVLDISGTGNYSGIVYWGILNNRDCPVTHLYMERCVTIPRIMYECNMKIEFVSVAGLRDKVTTTTRRRAIDSIRYWAAIPTLREMNASGCQMSQAQRQQIVDRHPNVIFNMSREFQESPRVKF